MSQGQVERRLDRWAGTTSHKDVCMARYQVHKLTWQVPRQCTKRGKLPLKWNLSQSSRQMNKAAVTPLFNTCGFHDFPSLPLDFLFRPIPQAAGKCLFYLFRRISLSSCKMHAGDNKSNTEVYKEKAAISSLLLKSLPFQQRNKARLFVSTLVSMFIQPHVNICSHIHKSFLDFFKEIGLSYSHYQVDTQRCN